MMLCHLGEDMKLKTLPVIPVRDLSIYESLPLKGFVAQRFEMQSAPN